LKSGEEPNENARLALEQAMQLASFDKSLRMNAAMMQASEGKIAIARQTIAPIANDPHGGGLAQTARRFYEAMGQVDEGTRWNPGATIDLATAIADAATGEDTGSE
jgi:Flp pilus assembly protein TadD